MRSADFYYAEVVLRGAECECVNVVFDFAERERRASIAFAVLTNDPIVALSG